MPAVDHLLTLTNELRQSKKDMLRCEDTSHRHSTLDVEIFVY